MRRPTIVPASFATAMASVIHMTVTDFTGPDAPELRAAWKLPPAVPSERRMAVILFEQGDGLGELIQQLLLEGLITIPEHSDAARPAQQGAA